MKREIMAIGFFLCILPGYAIAQSALSIKIIAEKEVVEVVNGEKIVKVIEAKESVSGETIIYTIIYENNSTETATNVIIDDPIPAGTQYVDNSAKGDGADIQFSVDGGKTYRAPSLLTFELAQPNGKIEKVQAIPEQYTDIRWKVATIERGKSGQLSFMVKIK